MKEVKRIAVVGGGTAGYIAALTLARRLNCKIDMIASSKIGIIGVGEGSTEHFDNFRYAIGESPIDILRKTNGSLKVGVMFKDWTKEPFMVSNQTTITRRAGESLFYIEKLIADGKKQKDTSLDAYWNNTVPKWYADPERNRNKLVPTLQYHLNTFKLNEYLSDKAKEFGVKMYDDEILDIKLSKDGSIDKLKGKKKTYKYDFYIDCTGFRRALLTKLGAKWQSYGKYLKMKAAIAFPTNKPESYNTYTLAQRMKYGWLWRTPVYDRCGNGYAYDSDYITPEQAQKEAEKYLGHKVEIARSVKFDPGALDKVWIKNCCAIGLAASFVEPLEASSIGSAIQQVFMLMHELPLYNQKTIDKYNKDADDLLTNIRDFLIVHYLVKNNDSKFWKDIQKLEIPDYLQEQLDVWKHRLPLRDDFNHLSRYILFTEAHWTNLLFGIGHFDRKMIKKRFNGLHKSLQTHGINDIKKEVNFLNSLECMPHKDFLFAVHNNYK